MNFQPQDPAFANRVEDSFKRQGVMAYLGATLTRIEPGNCEVRIEYRPELSQQHGYFHGGVVGTIADSAAGYAGYSLMPDGSSVLTVEYKLNFMAPASGEQLIATGQVIKAGKTLIIARADVTTVRDGDQHLCATLLQTLMCMQDTPDSAPAQWSSGKLS